MSRFGPPPAMDRTAMRPGYATLPGPVRRCIETELGGSPATVDIAGGGFTMGFAARLRADSGMELFVKAAGPQTPLIRSAYQNEARYSAALPTAVPAPRIRFATDIDEWTVIGFEAVHGEPVTLPMRPETVRRLLDTWAEAAELLDPPPAALVDLGIRVKTGRSLKRFNAVASGETPPFPLPRPLQGRIDELAALEAPIDEVIASSERISHSDLRPDNMIIGTDRAWICDWTSIAYMEPWMDTVLLLLTAHGDGHDADSLFWSHATAREVAEEELDTALAAITGGLLQGWAGRPDNLVSPAIDGQMRWAGLVAADWLARRRGW